MTTLADELDRWWRRWVQPRAESDGRRAIREATAGPLWVQHTFEVGSSHADLAAGLVGRPMGDRPSLTVHSFELSDPGELADFPVWLASLTLREQARESAGTPWRIAVTSDPPTIRCLHRETGAGAFVTFGPVPSWEQGNPLRPFLSWMAATWGGALLHAGTVGTPAAMGLIGGPGGTGKTSTVLTGLAAGLDTCGDDYIWLQPTATGTSLHAVYRTMKTCFDAEQHPSGAIRRMRGPRQKWIHWLDAPSDTEVVAGGQLVTQADLRACLLLRPPGGSGGTPSLGEVLATLLPSTLFHVPGDEAHVTAVARRAIADLPVIGLTRDGDYAALGQHLRASLLDLADSLVGQPA